MARTESMTTLRRLCVLALLPLAIVALAFVAAQLDDEPAPAEATEPVGTAAWALELLDSLEISDQRAPDSAPYDRDDYDRWIDADDDCRNTRHEVLVDESTADVRFTDDAECKVAGGRWVDPYTGASIDDAIQASIDHVVALSEAHHAGAWTWDDEWKVALFNDLDDPATLAVSLVSVNQSKAASGPENWLPQDADRRCAYLIARVRVKARWQLTMGTAERQVTFDELTTCDRLALPSAPESAPFERIDFTTDTFG